MQTILGMAKILGKRAYVKFRNKHFGRNLGGIQGGKCQNGMHAKLGLSVA